METGSAQGEGGLYLLSAKTKVIPFQLVPQPEDVGKLLQVKKYCHNLPFESLHVSIIYSYEMIMLQSAYETSSQKRKS